MSCNQILQLILLTLPLTFCFKGILLDGFNGKTQLYLPLSLPYALSDAKYGLPHNLGSSAVILNNVAYFIGLFILIYLNENYCLIFCHFRIRHTQHRRANLTSVALIFLFATYCHFQMNSHHWMLDHNPLLCHQKCTVCCSMLALGDWQKINQIK